MVAFLVITAMMLTVVTATRGRLRWPVPRRRISSSHGRGATGSQIATGIPSQATVPARGPRSGRPIRPELPAWPSMVGPPCPGPGSTLEPAVVFG